MANADFINILREIRGSAAPGQPITDGIWHELTIADKNGNPGIYGDILAKYGIVTESAGTFDQAVAILENLNVEVTTLPAGSQATSALVDGVWQIGIPRGTAGIDGLDGFTPAVAMNYSLGNLNYTVTVDGVQITNTVLVNLDELVDTRVNANVDVQTTLTAKQEVLDAVADAQAIADGLDANVAAKIVEISAHTVTKIGELSTASDNEKVEIGVHTDAKIAEYDANAVIKTHQYNDNHEVKLAAYNANDTTKLAQYNANHIERLENLDEKYATRIIDMLNTNKILGMVDKFAATVPTQYATFIDTALGSYIYYLNGAILTEVVDYTVINATTIQMTTALAYGDIVTQVDSQYIGDYLTFEGVILEERIGQPDGVAGLDETGKVPAAQLPSYVDDVVEVATKAALPAIGEIGKIYVVIADETSNGDTSSYRWTGSIYAMVSNTLNAADVKALYESNANTNAYTDAEKSRVAVGTVLQTVAQTLPSAINELDTRIDNIVDNTTLAEYGITDAYTKTEVQETLPAIGLDITNITAPTRVGQMRWNQDEGTVDLALQNGVTLQMGQENNRLVRNGTASPLANMTVCMFAGTIGNSGRILVAPFDGVFTHTNYIYGVATQSIAAGVDGYITIEGKVRNVNTTGAAVGEVWADGDILYAKPNDAGTLTKVEPEDDELKIVVASVVHAHTSGTLEVRVLPFNENMIAKRANKLTTARTIELSGDVSGSVSFDGSADVSIAVTVADDSHSHAFANITAKPTTLDGYGITDAVPRIISVDNQLVRFNGTTGEVQGCPGVFVDDSGNLGVVTSTPSTYKGKATTTILAVGTTVGNNGVSVVSGSTSTGSYQFADSGGNDRGGITYYHTADVMALEVNGSERMRIDSSGNVGIGTSSPFSVADNINRLTISGTSGASLLFEDTGYESTGDGVGRFEYNDGSLAWLTGSRSGTATTSSTERMRIDSSGNVGLGVTPSAWYSNSKVLEIGATALENLTTTGADAFGIFNNAYRNTSNQFIYKESDYACGISMYDGATSLLTAPSGTAGNPITWTTALAIPNTGGIQLPNRAIAGETTLDWYEEGTFTPAVTFSGGTSNNTYSVQTGNYTRIGDIVYYSAKVTLTAKDAGGSGYVTIAGLPFSTSKYNSGSFTERIGITPSGAYLDGMAINVSGTSIRLIRLSTTSYDNIQYSEVSGTMSLTVSGTYKV